MFELRTKKITYLAMAMIIFGIIEMITVMYFTQKYGIGGIYVFEASGLDFLLVIAGTLVLTMKKDSAALAILLLFADIVGRVSLVLTKNYPFNGYGPGIAMILGTMMAGVFALYIWAQLGEFRSF